MLQCDVSIAVKISSTFTLESIHVQGWFVAWTDKQSGWTNGWMDVERDGRLVQLTSSELVGPFFLFQAFNTFIDDVFAFIITMPTSHRVAVFRDDVVFLVYLYQRWLVSKNISLYDMI